MSFNGNVMFKMGMQQFEMWKRNSRTIINNYFIHIQTLIFAINAEILELSLANFHYQ